MASGPAAPESSPLLDDQPAAIDLLGFDVYARALQGVIENKQARTPFIVGIFGRWGTGKTTLMRLIEERLKPGGSATVWFSAWVYGREDEIWAALMQCLVTQISKRLRFVDKLRFSLGLYARGLAWDRLLLTSPQILIRALLIAAPVVIAGILTTAPQISGSIATALTSAGLFGSALVAWRILKPVFDKIGSASGFDMSLTRSMDFEQHIGFLDRFREQFSRLVKSLPASTQRVVVFIDDLDRCEPEKALQLLDSVKVFLDVPGCIFVLGLDVQVIKRALELKYPQDPVAQREYLSKIVQLPFHLPPSTEADLRAYLGRLDVQFPDPRCGDVFLSAVANNPREIKRVINTYSLNWYLASARVEAGVTAVRLAKIVVIQQAFEQLHTLLRERPEWLALLESGLRGAPPMPPPGLSPDPQSTVIMGPSGVALPPAISGFLEEPLLRRLLTQHPIDPIFDDANFAGLSGAEIAVYFTFTGAATPPDTSGSLGAPPVASFEASPMLGFGSRYKVLGRLGMGGVSETLLAEDALLQRRVAIKRLLPTLVGDPEWRERFTQESHLLDRVTGHPNIVNIYDRGEVDGAPFYVMEVAQGQTLESYRKPGEQFDEAAQRGLLLPVFDAIAHIHAAGIVHGDIKPASIIVLPSGVPKLVDFGLAFLEAGARDRLTSPGTVVGTLSYLSPEKLTGRAFDARSDLFSWGAVIYECLAGSRVFDQGPSLDRPVRSPSSLNPKLSKQMDAVIARMLAVDPEARYQTASEARAAFDAAIEPVLDRSGDAVPP